MAGSSLLSKASSAVAACLRRVSRATCRLLRARRRDRRQLVPADAHHHHQEEPCVDERETEGAEEDALWRRAILMGERCKPLDFPGVIHYDSFGRRLSAPPPHRVSNAALLCCSMYDVDEAAIAAPRKAMARRA